MKCGFGVNFLFHEQKECANLLHCDVNIGISCVPALYFLVSTSFNILCFPGICRSLNVLGKYVIFCCFLSTCSLRDLDFSFLPGIKALFNVRAQRSVEDSILPGSFSDYISRSFYFSNIRS